MEDDGFKGCFPSHSVGLSEMVIETASSPGPFRNTQMSKASQTHKLRKLRAPSKCRECDGLVVFHGAECEEVTLVSFFPFIFHNQLNKIQPVHDPLFRPVRKCGEPAANRVEHCQSFTTASLSVMACKKKNLTKTEERDHLSPQQLKEKVEFGHKLSPENKSTNWSQLGNGQWKPKTFCLSSEESPPSTLYPPHPCLF